jgi:hypothetical protein
LRSLAGQVESSIERIAGALEFEDELVDAAEVVMEDEEEEEIELEEAEEEEEEELNEDVATANELLEVTTLVADCELEVATEVVVEEVLLTVAR